MQINQTNPFRRICSVILFITVAGCIGWIYETIFTSILWGHFCGFFARGLLHLPVCPIYGFVSLLLLSIFRIPFFQKYHGIRKVILAFFIGGFISTALELLTSYLMDLFLGEFLWSYENWFCNFQGRISLPSSLLFGMLTVFLITIISPFFQRVTKKLPDVIIIASGIFCGMLLLIDLLLSI